MSCFIPLPLIGDLQVPHPCQYLVLPDILILAILKRMKLLYLMVALISFYWLTMLKMFSRHLYIFYFKCLFKSLGHFYRLFEISLLMGSHFKMLATVFLALHFLWTCGLIVLTLPFDKQKFLILMKPNLSFIYFYLLLFMSKLKHVQLFQDSQRYSSLFFP